MVGRGSQYSCQRFLAALKQARPHWKDMSHARTCFTENLPPCLNFRLQRQGLRRHPWESQPLRQTRQDCLSCIAGITGFSERHIKRLVKSLVCERRLLRVDKRVLWPGVLGAQRTLAGHFWDSEKTYERRCFRSAERM
jgi:hypothetical protein